MDPNLFSGAVLPVCFLTIGAAQSCIPENRINIQIISIPHVADTHTHKQDFSVKPSNCKVQVHKNRTLYKENTQLSLCLPFFRQIQIISPSPCKETTHFCFLRGEFKLSPFMNSGGLRCLSQRGDFCWREVKSYPSSPAGQY